MSTSATVNLDLGAQNLMVTLSSGPDGDAYLVDEGQGSCYELRVLSRATTQQRHAITHQLTLLPLVQHPGVRGLSENNPSTFDDEFKLVLEDAVDPDTDRLSERIGSLDPLQRLQIAASIVDVASAAHRIGLFHGTFAPSTILLVRDSDHLQPKIDFSAMRFEAGIADPVLTLEHDLTHLRMLLQLLLTNVVDASTNLKIDGFGGRKRAILRQWIHPPDNDLAPPSLGQWRSVLDAFLIKPKENRTSSPGRPSNSDGTNVEQTGIIDLPHVLVGSGSTSQLGSSARADGEPIPVQLGRFRIDAKIGEGGMGSVYRGTDMANGETVAVKVLRNVGKEIARSIRRFHKEARVLSAVQNDHVTRMIEVGEDEGRHFIVMEFVPGIDLKTWLANRQGLPETEALNLAADLARSLVDAHASEVIHRDIKPENVLLKLNENHDETPEELAKLPLSAFTLKLTDFGIARHVNQSESMEMTKAGSVMGTPKYMSPEQCKSANDLTPSADIYSLGVTLYELLTGEVPYIADDFMKLAAKHCFDPVPSPKKRNATISDGADRIVQRALSKSPEERFGDAAQMLAELLRLIRGESENIEAHPRLPETHHPGRVWDKTVAWDLDSAATELWPLVSNTERLNEALGFPAVDYHTEKDPEKGIRKFGAFTLSGIKVSWEEHPFEWVEGQRMGILREFDSGPFLWFMSVVTLSPSQEGGSRLTHQVRIEPRNFLGKVMTTIEADWKGFRNLDKVYRRMDRSIQGKLAASEGSDPFTKPRSITRHQRTRLVTRIDRVMEAGVDSAMCRVLQQCIETWSGQDLASLRPIAMADRLGVDSDAMLDACLHAADAELLCLRWNILCPTCRVSASTSNLLSDVNAHTHCEACDIDFQSNLASAIELVFQVHPEIRDANVGQYCIGGPEHSPHVVAQVRVESQECLDLSVDLGVGDYLIRGPQLPRTQTIHVQATAAPSTVEYLLSTIGQSVHTPNLRSGRQTITIRNDSDTLKIVRVERMIPRQDVVTAAMMSANPTFRKLFPGQSLSADNPIQTDTMTFMATSINNVELLYESLGEAEAYAAIQTHHDRIASAVSSASGTVVKTIGEKMLASFNRREDAMVAATRIRAALVEDLNLEMPKILVGIGIHSGPALVTTQNSRLDYFGATVRAVSELPVLADGDTFLTEAVYSDVSVNEQISIPSSDVEIVRLPGVPQQRVKRIVANEVNLP